MGNHKNAAVIVCFKTFLFFVNILLWLKGCFLLLLGLWAEFDLYKYMEVTPEFSETAPHVIVGVAVLIIIITSIGFSCIVKGQPVLLYIYGGFMACVFMMHMGAAASIACYEDSFLKSFHAGLTQSLVGSSPYKSNFDFTQTTMHCCGVNNYTDWMRLSPQRVIPLSCCIDLDRCITANYSDVYQRGCYEVILEYLENNSEILIAIAAGAALLPVIGAVMAFGLASYIKKANYDVVH